MLNPAGDSDKAEKDSMTKLVLYRHLGLTAFVNNVIGDSTNAGYIFGDCMSYFDLKTAAFLSAWPNSNINFPQGFVDPLKEYGSITEDTEIRLIANHNCLQEKLQLELLPYFSKSFKGVNKGDTKIINMLKPFVETILDEIFRVEREYVIFAGTPFLNIFSSKNYNGIVKVHQTETNNKLIKDDGNFMRASLKCTPITITYGKKQINAIIANSFPLQSLSRALSIMRQYGEFCYNKI